MIEFIEESRGGDEVADFLRVRDLLLADWESPEGPLHLSAELPLSDLAGIEFFFNTRLFLAALAEGNGAPTTSTGNLNRVFVGLMFDRVKLPAVARESIRRFNKVLNEQDLWVVHMARIISECARLIARRKKRFQLTKSGRALLPDDKAGALYRALFVAYFRRFDLCYWQSRDVPGIQQTVAATLWRLDSVARDWTPVRGLAPQILLPGVLNQMHQAMLSEYDKEEWILAGYLLNPLFDFGLIETEKGGEWGNVTDEDAIRVTALWRKFIRFA